MKKSMKKFMIACAAVSTVAVAAGMSAMAADISDKYDATNNSIVLSVPADADEGTQATVLVVPTDKKAAVADADILYINQGEVGANNKEGTVLLRGDSLADGTYSALVGYYKGDTFTIQEDTFTIGEAAPEYIKGDANQDNKVNVRDASTIVQYVLGNKDLSGTAFLAADVTSPVGTVNLRDASRIVQFVLGNVAEL